MTRRPEMPKWTPLEKAQLEEDEWYWVKEKDYTGDYVHTTRII